MSMLHDLREFVNQRDALVSIARRWVALDAGSWHPDRHAAEKKDLIADTEAAIARAERLAVAANQ